MDETVDDSMDQSTEEVEEVTTEGARAHIDELAQRYTGSDYEPEIESERVLLRIRADRLI